MQTKNKNFMLPSHVKSSMAVRQKLYAAKAVYITCVIPVHNEAEGIENFLCALEQQLKELTNYYEIIVVNDGSTDKTANIVDNICDHNSSVKLLTLSRNFGKETALSAGLEHCQGYVAVLIDSDFQHPLTLLPKFLHKWQEGYDMVYGICNDRGHETWIKRWFTKCFYLIMETITKLKIVANAGDFRLLDCKVVTALNKVQERARFMKGLYAWVGFSSIGIPFDPPKRATGTSSWRFKNLAELALTGITSFSNTPLRIWSFIGLIIAACSFVCALCIIIKTIIYGVDMPGYASTIVAVVFFGGIQLLSIGILGEYVARIFNEVKQRPKYLLSAKKGFDKTENISKN